MMVLALRDFLATGVVAGVPFGCDRQQLEAVAGEPEATGGVSRKHRQPVIWKYGDVELRFSRVSGGLDMIHIDRFSSNEGAPQGWGGLRVDPWVIRERMSRDELLQALDGAGLAYTLRPKPEWNQEIVVTQAGVKVGLVCQPDQFSDFIGLAYLTCWGPLR
jgi:hypothetical protein